MRYTENYIITSHDVDVNNNIKPTMLLRYLQETADHQMRDRKPSYQDLFFQGKSFILTRIAVEVYAQIHQYDHIDVQSWRCQEKGATFIRCYEIKRDGEVMARGYSEWAVSNMNTGKLCRASEVDIGNYETDEPLELDLPVRFRLSKELEYKNVGEKHVMCSDVDMNMHMNNTAYPNMLWNYIPDVFDKEVTSLTLRFIHEAPINSKVDIFMAQMPQPDKGDPRAEETWCFASTVNGETNVEALIGMKKTKKR